MPCKPRGFTMLKQLCYKYRINKLYNFGNLIFRPYYDARGHVNNVSAMLANIAEDHRDSLMPPNCIQITKDPLIVFRFISEVSYTFDLLNAFVTNVNLVKENGPSDLSHCIHDKAGHEINQRLTTITSIINQMRGSILSIQNHYKDHPGQFLLVDAQGVETKLINALTAMRGIRNKFKANYKEYKDDEKIANQRDKELITAKFTSPFGHRQRVR